MCKQYNILKTFSKLRKEGRLTEEALLKLLEKADSYEYDYIIDQYYFADAEDKRNHVSRNKYSILTARRERKIRLYRETELKDEVLFDSSIAKRKAREELRNH